MIRYSLLASSLIFLFFCAPIAPAQCDCPSESTEFNRGSVFASAYEELVAADLVFYGQVIAVTKVSNYVSDPSKRDYEAEVFFSAERAWKKNIPNILKLRQSVDGCALDFDIGDRWLIYGYYKEGLLRTGYCSRSRTADRKVFLDMDEFRKKSAKETTITKVRENVVITLPGS